MFKKTKGYSLIELMLVISIVMILLSMKIVNEVEEERVEYAKDAGKQIAEYMIATVNYANYELVDIDSVSTTVNINGILGLKETDNCSEGSVDNAEDRTYLRCSFPSILYDIQPSATIDWDQSSKTIEINFTFANSSTTLIGNNNIIKSTIVKSAKKHFIMPNYNITANSWSNVDENSITPFVSFVSSGSGMASSETETSDNCEDWQDTANNHVSNGRVQDVGEYSGNTEIQSAVGSGDIVLTTDIAYIGTLIWVKETSEGYYEAGKCDFTCQEWYDTATNHQIGARAYFNVTHYSAQGTHEDVWHTGNPSEFWMKETAMGYYSSGRCP